MTRMTKGRGERGSQGVGLDTRTRRGRRAPTDPNEAFLRAFADALRDILREERRRAA